MSVETFENESLVIHVHSEESNVTVRWEGTSDMRDPDSFLAPILANVVRSSKGKSLVIDLTAMHYMNSATVSPLVRLMRDLDRSEVKSLILWDAKIHWQRINFACMKSIARALSRVEVEAR